MISNVICLTMQVFDITLAWLQHDWANRKEHAPALLQQIRLGMVPLGYLSMTALRSAELYNIPECKDMIDNIFKVFDARKPDDAPLSYSHPDKFASRTTITVRICNYLLITLTPPNTTKSLLAPTLWCSVRFDTFNKFVYFDAIETHVKN